MAETKRVWPMKLRCAVLAQAGRASVACLVLAMVASGCSRHATSRDWSNPCKLQVQFYSPPGANVTVKSCFDSQWKPITEDESLDHRLELCPEEYAMFNLCPGHYQFRYTTAPGFPGVSIYGELEVHRSWDSEVSKFVRNALVPLRLPSRYYLDARPLHPTVGPAGASLNEIAMEQIAQGDMFEQVYFVADLDTAYDDIERINSRLDKLRSAEAVLNSSMEYYDARHEEYRRDSLYASPTMSIDDATKEFWGSDRKFNHLEADRQRLENQRYEIHQQVTKLVEERRIRRLLLDSMRIVSRSGALVLATPESQWPYHDTFDQVSKSRTYDGVSVGPGCNYCVGSLKLHAIGRVVAVLRVGGRHKHWDYGEVAVVDSGGTPDEYTSVEYREEVRTSPPQPVVE
ncbi:MAG: hypothetical protein GY842_18370 [bacterium]|nr:hypothetical protein [bacterium]